MFRRVAVLATLTLLQSQCQRQTEGPNVIRLVDLLPTARISSPLNDVPSAATLDDVPGQVVASTVFEERFESFTPSREGWLGEASCEPDLDGPGQRVLRCSGRFMSLFVIPAAASTYYRVQRRVWTTSYGCGDVVLAESRLHPDSTRAEVFRGGLTTAQLLTLHPFASPGQAWRHDSRTLLTSPYTHSLVIMARREHGCELLIDDLILEELRLTPAQRLSLLKASMPMPGGIDASGTGKRGRILIADSDSVPAPYDDNYTTQDGLIAPAPSDIRFELVVPPRARLRFHYAPVSWSAAESTIDFAVTIDDNSRHPKITFGDSVRIDTEADPRYWRRKRMDLQEFAGEKVTLTFTTRSQEAGAVAVWGDPVLDIPRQESDPPNIILLCVDTLRADRIGAYGSRTASTPNIDSLARDGIRFAQVVSQASWTLPSHASVFTGIMPSRHRADSIQGALARSFDTLAEHLKATGWATSAILYKPALADVGIDQGFDTFFNVPKIISRADDNLHKALQWLEQNFDRRFFLFLHFDDPHQPFTQPAEFLTAEQRRRLDEFGARLPLRVSDRWARNLDLTDSVLSGHFDGVGLTDSFKNLTRSLYDGEVTYVDTRIGLFLDELKRRDLYDDAIIVFFSDHGESMWEHGGIHGHDSLNFYDEVVTVPLILKPSVRSRLKPGTVVEEQVRLFDLMPTVMQMVGLEAPGIEARSLLNRATSADTLDEVAVVEARRSFGVRTPAWKFMYSPQHPEVKEALFCLNGDSTESVDVLEAYPEVAEDLLFTGLETRIRNGAGRYVVVTGDRKESSYDVRIILDRSSSPPEILYGIEAVGTDSEDEVETHRFAGKSNGPLVLVARIAGEGDSPVSVRMQMDSSDEDRPLTSEIEGGTSPLPAYETGLLERLADRRRSRIYLFQVTGIGDGESDVSSVADARRLEALRAHGYLN